MNADLLKETIINTDITEITDDMFKSFETMVKNDTFKQYHTIIQDKIEQYKKFIGYGNAPKTIEITPVIGEFYKTLNNSIVMILDVEPVKKLAQCLITKGGLAKKDFTKLDPILMLQGKCNMVGGVYVIDNNGKFFGQETDKDFSLHIVSKLNCTFTEQKTDENKA